MDLQLTTRERGDAVVVELVGELDLEALPPLRSHLLPLADDGARLVLDLSGVRFLDCSTLGALVGLCERARERGGRVRVVGLRPRQRAVVRFFGLEEVFGVAGTVAEALQGEFDPA
ncbi:anti-sigma B factor antagonist [Kineococcus xinjiangensis]|uniref:Anti-sigma factor antagonist n=1 Tax=Kineococcus xinjiangensis TaxID=512762 RepID=A0A2S6IEG2_9ACTN|nr:STAS domain-containing protein [Kineococcus xinjiangensis]PPK92587.1 anti-sigma B factor antagonist [Kineococcus xinjiangensis]